MAGEIPITGAQAARKYPKTGREVLGRLSLRLIAALVISAAVLYAADYALLRIRVVMNAQPFGSVTVRPYYAVLKKNRSTEFMFDTPRDEECVNSLLPHLRHSACWYLRRHKDRRIDM